MVGGSRCWLGFCKEALLPRVARANPLRAEEAELYWVHSCCLVTMCRGETLIGGGEHPPGCSTGPVRGRGGDRVAVAKPPQAAANATDQQPLKAAESATGTDTRAGRDTSDRWREAAETETLYYWRLHT